MRLLTIFSAWSMIIRLLREDIKPVGYAAGLTHGLTVKYLRGLIDQGLLRISHDAGTYRHYEITPKGVRFLKVFAEIEDDLSHLF